MYVRVHMYIYMYGCMYSLSSPSRGMQRVRCQMDGHCICMHVDLCMYIKVCMYV